MRSMKQEKEVWKDKNRRVGGQKKIKIRDVECHCKKTRRGREEEIGPKEEPKTQTTIN